LDFIYRYINFDTGTRFLALIPDIVKNRVTQKLLGSLPLLGVEAEHGFENLNVLRWEPGECLLERVGDLDLRLQLLDVVVAGFIFARSCVVANSLHDF
jgi:hypothetical protein